MISVIVFTKDRPMQLDAYLESLMRHSNVYEKQISIIYKENPAINYKKVIKKYSNCNWIYEKHFYSDLMNAIDLSQDYILFGCDDVVFKNTLQFEYAENLLTKNNDIFGFSFRLGKNIKPSPKQILKIDKHLEWCWANTSEAHYNYPWELDCTLYRKKDIKDILNASDGKIINPNFLESVIANEPLKFIKRLKLACLDAENQSIVITVNRVQETHLNSVDESERTSIKYLDCIYNEKNKKLDIHKIAKLRNSNIHVGSEYFILEGDGLIQSSNQIRKIKTTFKKIIRLAKNLTKNIIFLIKNDVSEIATNASKENLNLMLDSLRFEMALSNNKPQLPNIKNAADSVNEILRKKASFCRFGDGEFMLMLGSGIPFQKYDEKLSARLKIIFKSSVENILIGMPHFYFYDGPPLRNMQKYFSRTWVSKNRNLICSMADLNMQYYDTAATQLYALYSEYDFSSYFSLITKLWEGRNLVVICGKGIFDDVENNIFESAKSVQYCYAPSKDAFASYDFLLENAQNFDKNSLIIIVLGPTATVLAFDLAQLGYQAIDFGHIAKDYDFYKRGIQHNSDTIGEFYRAD